MTQPSPSTSPFSSEYLIRALERRDFPIVRHLIANAFTYHTLTANVTKISIENYLLYADLYLDTCINDKLSFIVIDTTANTVLHSVLATNIDIDISSDISIDNRDNGRIVGIIMAVDATSMTEEKENAKKKIKSQLSPLFLQQKFKDHRISHTHPLHSQFLNPPQYTEFGQHLHIRILAVDPEYKGKAGHPATHHIFTSQPYNGIITHSSPLNQYPEFSHLDFIETKMFITLSPHSSTDSSVSS